MLFLDMVNKVLSAIDSQSVSSIDDSDESEQVASIIQRCYDEILYKRNWPFLQTEGRLIPTYRLPNEMRTPNDCLSLIRVKYNKKYIKYISPEAFRNLVDSRTPNEIVNEDGIYTDRDPLYYTSYDDENLIFDAYNKEYDTLLENKSYCLYSRIPKEINGDEDTFDLPIRFQPALLNYAISVAMEELKQDTNAAQRYEAKFRADLANMLKWSKKVLENETKYNSAINYGMRGL